MFFTLEIKKFKKIERRSTKINSIDMRICLVSFLYISITIGSNKSIEQKNENKTLLFNFNTYNKSNNNNKKKTTKNLK